MYKSDYDVHNAVFVRPFKYKWYMVQVIQIGLTKTGNSGIIHTTSTFLGL